MTQGIQRSSHPREFSAAYLARITPKTSPVPRLRRDSWFVEALSDICRVLIGRRVDELPDSLIEDVGLGTSRRAAAERHSEFTRLDAQLHARFY
jgi:hypothetical protein